MTKGLTKPELLERRIDLILHIEGLEEQESLASSNIHQQTGIKAELTIKLIKAKNRLVHLDELIDACEDLS